MKTVIEVKEDGLAYVVNGQERILCADQAQAWTLAEPTGPGVYPIPDLQYEVKEDSSSWPGTPKTVAILKESTSTKQESQEDHIPGSGKMVEDEQDALWWKVFYVLEFSNVDPNNGIEELKRHFTITRKP